MGWGKIDSKKIDDSVQQEESYVSGISTGKFYKAAEGANLIRFLPPWNSTAKWAFKKIIQHAYNDAEGNLRMFVCPKSNKNPDGSTAMCLTCDHIIPSLKNGDQDDQEIAAKLKGQNAVMCNILDRGNPGAGAQIMRLSASKLYPQVLSAMRDPDYGDVTHPDKGHDFTLTRKGTGKDTKYNLMPKPKKTAVDLSAIEPIDLDEEYLPMSNSDQAKALGDAYGLEGLDKYIEEDEVAEDAFSDADVPFDTDEDETPDEKETSPDGDVERVPIELDNDMSKAQKAKALNVLVKKHPCFGQFDEDDDSCAVCSGMIRCAVKVGE